MDPVAGGNANAYVYSGDPVNGEDVSGDNAKKKQQKPAYVNPKKYFKAATQKYRAEVSAQNNKPKGTPNAVEKGYGGTCSVIILVGTTSASYGLYLAPLSDGTSTVLGTIVFGVAAVAQTEVCDHK